MNVEIEFLEWVHPRAGVTKVEVEGGKPLVLKAKIKHEWVGLTDEEISKVLYDSGDPDGLPEYARAIEAKLKAKNGY